jgi:branched-subunit amino acid ABC-type transport system permease component
MIAFVQALADGALAGSAYALLGIGFTLIFGVLRRINLAFGASILVGAFAGAAIWSAFKVGGWAVAAVTIAGAMLAGMYVERICFWAVRRDAALASMVSSFAIWMQLEELLALTFPLRTYAFPALVERSVVHVGALEVRLEHLAMFAVAAVTAVFLELLLARSRFGLAVRALTESREAARALGVPVDRIAFAAFALASAIGGLAAFLIASSEEQVTLHTAMGLTLKGLIAMMIGGMGSLRGAVIGGVLLGVVETMAQAYAGALHKEFASYGLLFLLLVLRPGGLFGSATVLRERAALERL